MSVTFNFEFPDADLAREARENLKYLFRDYSYSTDLLPRMNKAAKTAAGYATVWVLSIRIRCALTRAEISVLGSHCKYASSRYTGWTSRRHY